MGLKERKRQEEIERMAGLHKDLVTSIFKKIPDLANEEENIYLSKAHFKLLTDQEFIVLWALPNIVIRVAKSAADYLEERRLLLGLKRAEHSGVLRSNKDRIDGT